MSEEEDFDWHLDYYFANRHVFAKWHTKIVRLNNAIAGQDKQSIKWNSRMHALQHRFHRHYLEFTKMVEFLNDPFEDGDYGTEVSQAKYEECIAKMPRFRKRYRRARNAFNAYLDVKR